MLDPKKIKLGLEKCIKYGLGDPTAEDSLACPGCPYDHEDPFTGCDEIDLMREALAYIEYLEDQWGEMVET